MEQGGGESESQDVPHTSPENYTPAFLMTGFNVAVEAIETYGWFLLIIVFGVLYLIHKYKPSYETWKQQRDNFQEAERNKKDPEKAYAIQVSMEQSRLRLQERVKINAEKKRIKDEEMAEEKRLQKIEEWEKHKQGKGYHSKMKQKETPVDENGQPKLKRKNQFKPSDFNPLSGGGGGGGSSGYRPSRRNGGG